MKNIFYTLLSELENNSPLILATLVDRKGSAPQIPGASAIFSPGKLLHGTLGGGILEGDATEKVSEALEKGNSLLYDFELNADFSSEKGAICGGTARLLLDANPGQNLQAFLDLQHSIGNGNPGILATLIKDSGRIEIFRSWVERGVPNENKVQEVWPGTGNIGSETVNRYFT
jgi:xanthine dehydrogenase accessory factor